MNGLMGANPDTKRLRFDFGCEDFLLGPMSPDQSGAATVVGHNMLTQTSSHTV